MWRQPETNAVTTAANIGPDVASSAAVVALSKTRLAVDAGDHTVVQPKAALSTVVLALVRDNGATFDARPTRPRQFGLDTALPNNGRGPSPPALPTLHAARLTAAVRLLHTEEENGANSHSPARHVADAVKVSSPHPPKLKSGRPQETRSLS